MPTSDALPPIIDVDQLSALIAAPVASHPLRPLRLLDVRWALDGSKGRDTYLAGHLPGAVYIDLDTELAAPARPEAGRHPLPSPDDFAVSLRRAGIDEGDRIVAYDDSDGGPAGRLVWMLRALGHDAALLSGGLTAWTAGRTDGRNAASDTTSAPGALETGEPDPAPAPGNVRAREWSSDVIVTIDDVASASASASASAASASASATSASATSAAAASTAASGSASPLIIDARAAARYNGDTEPVDPRAGHIPGAVNLPYAGNLDADGRFLSPEQLRDRFAAAGADVDREVIVYCGSGVTASHDVLALEHAGFTKVRLFPGSWSQWSADPSRPAATGPTP
ncbi:sulfurtransferase [Brachybacterium sp. DNPG3]